LLVLHIGAHRSQLAELLNNASKRNSAVFARAGMRMQPGCIYIAPSDQHMLIVDGSLRLTHGPKEHHARPAINPLFRSAALAYGARAVGVVLSGMLDDGAAGLRAIKACGGTAVVQDPDEAPEPSMPRAALDAVEVDHVVKAAELPRLLAALAEPLENVSESSPPEWLRIEHAISVGNANMPELGLIAEPSALTCPDCGGSLFELKDQSPKRFLCHTGHAFSLLSLASTQNEVVDDALWRAIRVLQEQESILRRVADENSGALAPDSERALEKANQLEAFSSQLRSMVERSPAAVEVGGTRTQDR
jgi:two-component system, chemotaxis family, protein-glutamate methylesterase/glutaminase